MLGLAWTGRNFIKVGVKGRHRSRLDPRKLREVRAGPELKIVLKVAQINLRGV
jgi:hypothetical protein